MKRTIAFLSLILVFTTVAFAQTSLSQKAQKLSCSSCCQDGCGSNCCPDSCGSNCCQ